MGNLGIRFCWSLLRGEDDDWIIDPAFLRPPAVEVYGFIRQYWADFGVLPAQTTVLEEIRLEEEFREIAAPEPVEYYSRKLRERAIYLAQKQVASEQLAEALREKDVEAISLAATALANVGGDDIFAEKSVDQRENNAERWARYQRLKDSERGITGLRSPWPSVDEVTRGFNPGKIYSFVARPGKGKCVHGGALLPDPNTGIYRTLREVVQERVSVYSFSMSSGVQVKNPLSWMRTGFKKCLRIQTRLGFSITVTEEHPFLTSRGWVQAKELKKDDSVVAVAKVPEPTKPRPIQPEKVELLGLLLANGGLTHRAMVNFSTGDPTVVERLHEIGSILGLAVKKRAKYCYALTPSTVARKVLDEFGVGCVKSIHKRVPDAIFNLPNEQLKIFLRAFWWCDGGKDGHIGLSSEGLLDDIHRLLLRFGVVTKKAFKLAKCGGKTFDSWRLYLEAASRPQFKVLMAEMPGEKGKSIAAIQDPVNPNVDNVPSTEHMRRRIKEAASIYREIWKKKGERRGLYSDVGKQFGWTTCPGLRDFSCKHGRSTVSRRALRMLLKTADGLLNDLNWMVSEDIVFVQIADVIEAGEHEVFDLEVPDDHCFVADGLVVHNSMTLAFLLEWFRRQGRSVGLVSPEMPRETTELRLDAMRFGLPLNDLLEGQLDSPTEERYRAALESPDEGPGIFIAEGIWSLVEIESFVERNKPDVLIVDGIYMIEAGHPKQPRHERVEEAVRGLDRISKRRRNPIPVILSGQFNRSVKTDSLKSSAEGLAHADAIIQYSTCCFAIVQDEAMRMANQIKYRMLKNRDGLMVEVIANWDLETMDPTEIPSVPGDTRAPTSTDEEGELLWD